MSPSSSHEVASSYSQMHLKMDERSAVQCAGIVVVLQESQRSRKPYRRVRVGAGTYLHDAEYGRNHKKGGAVAERRQKASYQPHYDQCYGRPQPTKTQLKHIKGFINEEYKAGLTGF